MGIEIPTLDDREYAEIIEDARRRLPAYSGTWTDHNATDPGITVLELLAWLSETYLYQFDQITDAHRRKYVQLMGERVRPLRPARANLEIELPRSWGRVAIKEGTTLEATEGAGNTRVFETTEDVILPKANIDRIVSENPQGRIDNTTANATEGMHFLAFGDTAEPGSTMYIRFNGDPFVTRFESDPFQTKYKDDPKARGTLIIAVDFHEDELPRPAVHGQASTDCNEATEFEPSVDLSWQYCLGDADLSYNESWRGLTVQRDETNSLYQGGIIQLEKPIDWEGVGNRHLWIRCVVEHGGYEVPPPLNAIRVNVVTVKHGTTITNEELGGPEGEELATALPGQTFTFEHAPVLEADIEIAGDEWEETTDFDASRSDERHYVLDEAQGKIRFGDGVQGMVPPAGYPVRAKRYRSGGGTEGNVSETASWKFSEQRVRVRGSKMQFQTKRLENLTVSATGPATGGADAESVEAALNRIQRDRSTPYRAVSTDDYRSVALSTPGLRFGRAMTNVVTDKNAGDCSYEVVHVVVVPYSTTEKPTPSAGFLAAVQEHLDRHRLLTDRVEVKPPEYVGIGVDAEIRIAPGYSAQGRTAAVVNRLNKFLDPLKGFEGDGWPFGRSLYRSELHEAIENVEGVDYVLDIAVRTQNERGIDNGEVTIGETALFDPMDHDVTVQTDPADGRYERGL